MIGKYHKVADVLYILGCNPYFKCITGRKYFSNFKFLVIIIFLGVCNQFCCTLFRKGYLSHGRETRQTKSSSSDAGCYHFSKGPLKRGPDWTRWAQNSKNPHKLKSLTHREMTIGQQGTHKQGQLTSQLKSGAEE